MRIILLPLSPLNCVVSNVLVSCFWYTTTQALLDCALWTVDGARVVTGHHTRGPEAATQMWIKVWDSYTGAVRLDAHISSVRMYATCCVHVKVCACLDENLIVCADTNSMWRKAKTSSS